MGFLWRCIDRDPRKTKKQRHPRRGVAYAEEAKSLGNILLVSTAFFKDKSILLKLFIAKKNFLDQKLFPF